MYSVHDWAEVHRLHHREHLPKAVIARPDHRDVMLVAREDPYAFKGTADVMRPHVRPDGEGGCVR